MRSRGPLSTDRTANLVAARLDQPGEVAKEPLFDPKGERIRA